MRKIIVFFVACLCIFNIQDAFSQAGVCDRAVNDGKQKINADTQAWIDAINSQNYPQNVKDAHIVLFNYNRDNSLAAADQQGQACTAQYKPYQDVMDNIVSFYTAGLSKVLAPHLTHVDVSELLNGYPLGGPNALVPKFREQILNGDRGTVANIIRDPWACLTFAHQC